MSTIAENLTKLAEDRDNIATAISSKGVTVPEGSKLSEFPEMIEGIESMTSHTYSGMVAVGNYLCKYTTNGKRWGLMEGYNDDCYIYDICYSNEKYIGVTSNGVMYSTDGVSWTTIPNTPTDIRTLTYGNNLYVGIGYQGTSYYSEDGISWTESTNSGLYTSYYYSKVKYGNGVYVCMGKSIYYDYESGTIYLYRSTDGITWTLSTSFTATYRSLDFGYDKFICLVNSGVRYSSDGITWNNVSLTSLLSSGDKCCNVSYTGNDFVVCILNSSNYLYAVARSTTVTSWSYKRLTNRFSGFKANGVLYFDNSYFIYSSESSNYGIIRFDITFDNYFMPIDVSDNRINSICFGNITKYTKE